MKEACLGFLAVFQKINSLFESGCEISLSEEYRSLGIEGSDPHYEYGIHEEDGPMTSSFMTRVYECDPYVLINENTSDEEYIFNPDVVEELIKKIEADNLKRREMYK